jgi:hypothetical protein
MDPQEPPDPLPRRPPDIDADYRVVHGPWPRWTLQLGLLKLALRTAGIVAVLCLLALAIALVATRLK